jgi:hypothetical protein
MTKSISILIAGSLSLQAMAQNTFPATGSVGIGTTAPAHALDVRGNIYTNGSVLVDGGDVILTRTTHPYGYVVRPNTAGYKNLGFCTEGGGFLDNMSFSSALSAFSGKLGIGVTPQMRLDIATTAPNDGMRISTSNGFTLWHGNSLGPGSWNSITNNGDAGIIYGTGSQPAGSNATFGFVIAPWHGGMTGIRIDKEGNVGIATNDTKGYRFAVNGDAMFTKVKVKVYNTWPDYVFAPGYQLPSLAEVEKYILTYQHLPGIPAANEIEKEGLDIGDTQAALLKKIEELTLYIVQQQKDIEALKTTNKMLTELSNEVKAIKKTLTNKNN